VPDRQLRIAHKGFCLKGQPQRRLQIRPQAAINKRNEARRLLNASRSCFIFRGKRIELRRLRICDRHHRVAMVTDDHWEGLRTICDRKRL
jgi:hypothetical protein